ncbi:MAG: DEAD/DEAH box helicase [Verrucomicrobia bacterium]|nr:DEAD/DEAH box helicase [Verrucomicrobiota bacterium]
MAEAPGLRLAWPIGESERVADPVLAGLAWAETVVRAEVKTAELKAHLRKEISSFPAEFLLFLPVSMILELDDGTKPQRVLRADPDGKEIILRAGTEQSRWRVIFREVKIKDGRARADATHIHARDKVPLAWAIPSEGKRDESGRFWAFFPTHTATYLPGILNAPWKLNSDRNAIVGGEWNTALMREAARLIVKTLPELSTSDDPGRLLDAFPRQLERKDEDATPLVEAIWEALESAAVLPDANGKLRPARKLCRYPRDNANLARHWQALADDAERAKLVHPSCMDRQRASRLNALAERLSAEETDAESVRTPTWVYSAAWINQEEPIEKKRGKLRRCNTTDWFAAVATASTKRALEVLKLAKAFAKDCKTDEWDRVRDTLAIIPAHNNGLLTAEKLVFAAPGIRVPDGRHPVARALSENAEAKRILTEVMEVKPLDDSVWETVLDEAFPRQYPWESPSDEKWRAFWSLLRSAPEKAQSGFASRNATRIRVRRRDGQWVSPSQVLLPGKLVSADDNSANKNVLVDPTMHGKDTELLKAIGATDSPDGTVDVHDFSELDDWLRHWRSHYSQHVNGRARWEYLEPSWLKLPNGWRFLPILSDAPNAELSARFLEQLGRGEFPATVKFGHSTVQSYPDIDVPHPLPWFVLKHGLAQVGNETVRLAAVVARRHEPALTKLPCWDRLNPTLERLQGAQPPVQATPAEIRALWHALIKLLATPEALADDSLRELWAGAAKDDVVPDALPGQSRKIPLSQVFVTESPDLARRARTNGRTVVTLDDHALQLWLKKGAQDLASLMSPHWTEQTGPEALLVSIVPELAEVMQTEVKKTARCQPVAGLKLNVAGQSEPVPCLMWGNSLLLDSVQLAARARADRLKCLLGEIAPAGWLKYEPEEALRILGDAQVDALRAKVVRGKTLAKRLLLAVGNRSEPLRQALGTLADMDFIKRCSALGLAELILAQLGPATLVTLREALEAEGLQPPARWGTSEAREFVASIGFPEEYAASAEGRREPEEFISGPIELPPLHDFQEEVLHGIRSLLAQGQRRRRAVISLPTGGGKTRVTVEAAVLLVLKPEADRRSVLWIAQTDELCEQAVQAFRQVWINLGAKGTNLRIIRLWGGNPNPVSHEPGKPVVVVASIQTFNSRMCVGGLEWLQKPGLVVVDECHHAITPSYTNLLRWLDAEAPRHGQLPKDEPPILGLSATPFRTDDDESHRLAQRFDRRWLPADQEHLHRRLLAQGVLAKVEAEPLNSGVAPPADLIETLFSLLDKGEGIDFDRRLEELNKLLAGNKQRNERLVECIKKAGEKSILFFANSVLHAEEMSARLNIEGIPAAAVSGDTPTVARRYFLDRFQSGEIRVLCNHTVLSTGFDAPKTDMILIARQVFSPVRYMQMVGRGLRGPKNGGTPTCRIVTVLDNLGRFAGRHPYHYCQRYFNAIAQNGA